MSERDIDGYIEVIREIIRTPVHLRREPTEKEMQLLVNAGLNLLAHSVKDLNRIADAIEVIARRGDVDPSEI